jgi:hypothetical protein
MNNLLMRIPRRQVLFNRRWIGLFAHCQLLRDPREGVAHLEERTQRCGDGHQRSGQGVGGEQKEGRFEAQLVACRREGAVQAGVPEHVRGLRACLHLEVRPIQNQSQMVRGVIRLDPSVNSTPSEPAAALMIMSSIGLGE